MVTLETSKHDDGGVFLNLVWCIRLGAAAAAAAQGPLATRDRSFGRPSTAKITDNKEEIIAFDIIKICGHQQPLKHEVLWPHK